MKPPQSENDLFEFAFDTEDKAYPIYREKIVSDKPSIACVATGIYNSPHLRCHISIIKYLFF